MTDCPLDTNRPLAFFGSNDKENWVRLATAVLTGVTSFEAQPVIADTGYRFLKIDYDDAARAIA